MNYPTWHNVKERLFTPDNSICPRSADDVALHRLDDGRVFLIAEAEGGYADTWFDANLLYDWLKEKLNK